MCLLTQSQQQGRDSKRQAVTLGELDEVVEVLNPPTELVYAPLSNKEQGEMNYKLQPD